MEAVVASGRFSEVRCVARTTTELPDVAGVKIKFIPLNLLNEVAVLKAVAGGVDVVVNCAGIYRWWLKNPAEYSRVNVDGLNTLLLACIEAKVGRVINISTAMAYGYPAAMPFNEASQPGKHASEYTRSKHLGDELAKKLADERGLPLCTLFLGCVLGAGDVMDESGSGRPASVCNQFLEGNVPVLVAPDTKYIYVHINDVTAAILAACTQPEENIVGHRFLIGNHRDQLTTRELFEEMAKIAKIPCPKATLNIVVAFVYAILVTWLAYVTGHPPQAPLDVLRTALWGPINYDCTKSEEVLNIQYTPGFFKRLAAFIFQFAYLSMKTRDTGFAQLMSQVVPLVAVESSQQMMTAMEMGDEALGGIVDVAVGTDVGAAGGEAVGE
ncbi:hypothetical protein CYMTET_13938 [Cymbomonas tetramitiformis]|uniref:NAD-dependent epimerase/dehydratase domain-containing protein n=1 Tax=Cymbomonas tetramitiformis TaxID=36881 RepID=A0AAE0GHE9_9CHLO|nr:hypothetical protein CYMTET_13938 [Cymbomonas tetramitiformis]